MTELDLDLYYFMNGLNRNLAASLSNIMNETVQPLADVKGELRVRNVVDPTFNVPQVAGQIERLYQSRFKEGRFNLCHDIAAAYTRSCLDHWSDGSQLALDFSKLYCPVQSNDYRFGIGNIHRYGSLIKQERPEHVQRFFDDLAPIMPQLVDIDNRGGSTELSLTDLEKLFRQIFRSWLKIDADENINWAKLTLILMTVAYTACQMIEVAGYTMLTGARISVLIKLAAKEMERDGSGTLLTLNNWDTSLQYVNTVNSGMVKPLPNVIRAALLHLADPRPLPANASFASPSFPGVCPPADRRTAFAAFDTILKWRLVRRPQ